MRVSLLVGLLSIVLAVPAANAYITGATFQADGDGALSVVALATWGTTDISFMTNGSQYWGPGHLMGEVYTNTNEDPVATSNNTITNDTTFAWTGYTVNLYMNKTFNISAATGPASWTNGIVAPAFGAYTDGDGRNWAYMGSVNYTSLGSAFDIPVGGSGSFGVTFDWIGSSVYQLELVPVPEPMSLALLALGGLFLRRRIR